MKVCKYYWLIAITVASFFGCKKEAIIVEAPFQAELTIARISETIFDTTTKREKKLEYGYAVFHNGISRFDGGIVTYGLERLVQFSPSFEYGLDNGTDSLNFTSKLDGGKVWSISGNQTNRVPAFTVTAADYPTFLQHKFDTLPVVQLGRPFTFTWDNTIPCDSLSVTISSGFSVVKTAKPSNVNSVTFTDLYALFPGKGQIIIFGSSRKDTTVAGLKIKVETIAMRISSVRII